MELMILLGILQDSSEVVNEVVQAGVEVAENLSRVDRDNTAKEIMAFILDLIVGIPILAGIGYVIYLIIRGKDISKELTSNPKHMFETIIVVSSLAEILVLSILALERGVPLSAALFRYGLAGVMEILLSFVFSTKVFEAIKDRKITYKEAVSILLFFMASLASTLLILVFYLESNGTLSWFSDNHYEVKVQKEEFGAYFTILCTIPLNLLSLFFQVSFSKTKYVGREEADKSKRTRTSKGGKEESSGKEQADFNRRADLLISKGKTLYQRAKTTEDNKEKELVRTSLTQLSMQYAIYRSGIDAGTVKDNIDALNDKFNNLKEGQKHQKEFVDLIKKQSGN